MWRQKEDPTGHSHLPTPDEAGPIVARYIETSSAVHPQGASGSQGSLGEGTLVRGEISGSDSLHVEGTVEGSIFIPGGRVTIGRQGRIIAAPGAGAAPCVRAREIVLLGSVSGNIEAEDCVEMWASASLIGNVSTQRVSIEDGAYFRGGIDIRREAAPGQATATQSAPQPVHA